MATTSAEGEAAPDHATMPPEAMRATERRVETPVEQAR
jgi:hypothetical protein